MKLNDQEIKRPVVRWLLKRTKRHLPVLLLMTGLGILGSYLSVYFAQCSQRTIDAAGSGQMSLFRDACIAQGVVVAGSLILSVVSAVIQDSLACRLDRKWRRENIHLLLHCDFKRVSAHHSAELINRMSADANTVNRGILSLIPGIIAMVVRLIYAAYVLIGLEPVLAGVVAVMGVVTLIAVSLFRAKIKDFYLRVREMNGRFAAFLQDVMGKLMIVQALDVSEEIERRADVLLEERFQLQRKRRHIKVATNTAFSLFTRTISFLTLIWCVVRVFKGETTFGAMTATLQLFSQMRGPVMRFSGLVPQYAAVCASAERLMELEDMRLPDVELEDPAALYPQVSGIQCENLRFSYDENTVIDYPYFRIPAGKITVITGASGIGKSTLFKLLLGIYAYDDGRLYLETAKGAMPISRKTRSLFAYVPQGNLLFSDTLRNNLLLTAPNATDDELMQALHVSALDDTVRDLPEGLNTKIGENALGLSEGQAQRVSIARAILSGAPILLLDECTSALDAATEATVLRRIAALKNRTCVIVTHRTAALDLADWEIAMQENGLVCRPLNRQKNGPEGRTA